MRPRRRPGYGHDGRGVAGTAVDLLTGPDLLEQAWQDFHAAG
ncbi:hypothetical protein [Kutzneria chonburiensis]|uniref:Uncharacterized protein n=1 Tax=Kutzneria chonburiensis TaxID=1483604 RepID=A0ABV6MPW5_9PSEU|nr:hypothetical protein [Kutzneria chonburiensis]